MHISIDINKIGNIIQHKKKDLFEDEVELQVHECKKFRRFIICDNRIYILRD